MSSDLVICAYAIAITVLLIIVLWGSDDVRDENKRLQRDLAAAKEREEEARRAMNAANRSARWHG